LNDKQINQLWPPADYYRQLEQLRAAVGQTVYLAELRDTAINAGVKISDEALRLLAVTGFPEPDPHRQLCPHMLVLSDGRGVNLGRIARVSINQAFGPAAEDVLYENHEFLQEMLFAPRSLSRESLAATSREILSLMFGEQPGRLLAQCYDEGVEQPVAAAAALNDETPADKNSGE
jgi:hypothetical protein